MASAADPAKSKISDVTVTSPAVACGDSGSESLLNGQYAFSLSGYNPTGYLAVVGSLTFDGSGHFTTGEVNSNGTLGGQSAVSINTSASSYSVGSNHLGCATIVTSFGTFNTRLSVGSITSSVAAAGRMIEWDSPTSGSYFAATGQILQQSPVSGAVNGNYVFNQSGIGKSGERVVTGGVITFSSGSITAGETDYNDAGTVHHIIGVTGTTTSVGGNGRFTMATTWTGDSSPGHVVCYRVSGSRALLMTTDSEADRGVTTGEANLQSGTFSNGSVNGKMVYYLTGLNNGESTEGRAELGLVNSNGTSSLTATVYTDEAGNWSTPGTHPCTYSVASNGRMTLSGANCGGSGTPLFYLTAANTAVMLTTDSDVEIGRVVPQVVPSGGFTSTSLLTVPLYDGDLEVVSYGEATQALAVEIITPTGSGSVNIVGDYTAAGSGTGNQQADQIENGAPLGTVGSDGTFSTNSNAVVNAIMISTTGIAIVNSSNHTYPVIILLKQ